jgi:formylglycine-generating enzyme required for sulfatase activity
MRFVLVPPGKLTVGNVSGKPGDPDYPPREVTLTRGFYLAATEVSNAQLRVFEPKHDSNWGTEKWGKYARSLGGDEQPATGVRWETARAFCEWLATQAGARGRYRLPFEAEWEHAYRAGTTTTYFWGDDAMRGEGWINAADRGTVDDPDARDIGFANLKNPDVAFLFDDGHRVTAPVASMQTNPFGLYHMPANVAEWCAELWIDYASYPAGPLADPTGAPAGDARVLRGSHWFGGRRDCHASARDRVAPPNLGYHLHHVGLRVAMDLPKDRRKRR